MREGFDKEIDSLLRRTARAPAGARGNGASTSKPDTHLDADELAAFAEGALPEAARMNAVSHLADCGECRALAVNLTRAAGIETKLEKHALAAAASPARESKPARGWLAAIFAPRTLRYVAPALVVCLVAAVSFIALRSRGGLERTTSLRDEKNAGLSPSVATTQSGAQSPAESVMNSNASANMNTATTAPGTSEPASKEKREADAPVAESHNKDAGTDAPDGSAPGGAPAESKAAGEVAAAQPPPRTEEEDSAGGAPAPPEAAKSAKAAEVPASRSADNMKAGPPPAPVQTDDELARNDVQQKRAAQQRALEPQAPDGGRAQQRSAANNAPNSGVLASTPRNDRDARSRRENAAPARRSPSDQVTMDGADRSNASGESRSVAGHRFRRDGGAWVDVNYKPSMSSTGVRRGTDAYRSLVADIPELGRVAEQLGGEVIVVVRGRAYRIR